MVSRRNVLAAAIIGSLGTGHGAGAATITVDSLSDDPGTIALGQCRLRSAVSAANSDSAQQGCIAGSGVDTIVFDVSLAGGTIVLEQGVLQLTADVTVDGSGSRSGITVSGNNSSNIFSVNGGVSASLNQLTLIEGNAGAYLVGGAVRADGSLTVSNSSFDGNDAVFGGAIGATAASTVTVTNSMFSANRSTSPGGGGGALASLGNVTISGSSFSENTAFEEGGAVFVQGGEWTVTTSNFSDNSAGANGGAISGRVSGATSASVSISDSTLSSNTAAGYGSPRGGAISSTGVSFAITDSVISNNTAALQSGAVWFQGYPNYTATLSLTGSTLSGNAPGAITAYGGPVTIRESSIHANDGARATIDSLDSTAVSLINTTVSSNTPNYGALFAVTLVVENSTLIGNSADGIGYAGDLEMRNSVIAGSQSQDCDAGNVTSISANNNNFIGDGSCAGGAVNLLTGDPMLGPLQNNGGPTLSHAPMPGSPLTDAGDNGSCPIADQTGMPRPVDGDGDSVADCDIGSVEFVDVFPPIATLTPVPNVTNGGAGSFDVTVTYDEGDSTVDLGSVGIADISVTPGPLLVDSVAVGGTAESLVVTYTVIPPGGVWDGGDSGNYQIAVNANQVFDTATTGANAVAAGVLGGFTVTVVEIDVNGNGLAIPDGDNSPSLADGTAFGNVAVGGQGSAIFTIANTAAGTLMLPDPVEVLGAGFSTTQPADTALAAGESTTFTVTFAPTTLGPSSGLVTIANSDDDENPYTFALSGTGVDGPVDLIFADGFETPP